MTLAFSDTFDRADGPPGAGWVADSAVWSITSGRLGANSAGRVHPAAQPLGANCCQRIWVIPPTTGTKTFTLWFRTNAGATDYKYVSFVLGPAAVTVTIGNHVSGVNHNLSSNTLSYTWGTRVDCMASVAGDQVLAFVEGYQVVSCIDPSVVSNGLAALTVGGSTHYVDEYALYDTGGAPFTISATPSSGPVGEYDITLTNGGADWTPGTPGAPVFQAGLGTISSQVVLDEQTATLVYQAPTIDAQTLLYDPQNDFYFEIGLSTSLVGVEGGGGGGGLTTDQNYILQLIKTLLDPPENQPSIDYQLGWGAWYLGFTMNQPYGGSANPALADIIYALLDAQGRLATIDAQSYSAMSLIDGATNSGAWTLQNVWQYVQGTGAHTIADVLDAIAALGAPTGGDLTTILAQLAAIRTANDWTLGDVVGRIGDIRGTDVPAIRSDIAAVRGSGNPDIAGVLSAISALSIPDYGSQLDTIQTEVEAIPTNPVTSLQPVEDAISAHNTNLNNKAQSILDAIDAIPTNPITDLSGVLSAISALSGSLNTKYAALLAAIQALVPGAGTPTAPVWPGAANVTLGQAHNLATGLTIAENMHGVIIAITGAPTKQGYFTFDDARSWRNVGTLSFYDDEGHQEYQQFLGFESAIVCPKAMLRASGVKIRCSSGVTGTATGWTINAT